MFGSAESVIRLRRIRVAAPLAADGTRPGEWTDPVDALEIPNCWVSSSSSNSTATADRVTILTSKSLYAPPRSDVRAGDRIETEDGLVYHVEARPAADRNPFTGWQPLAEIPLTLVEG